MSKRATREVESRTPKREPMALRNNEQFVNVGAIKFHKGLKRKKRRGLLWALCQKWIEEERSKPCGATPIATGISNIYAGCL